MNDTFLSSRIAAISRALPKDNANTNSSAASKMYAVAEMVKKEYILDNIIAGRYAYNHRAGRVYINDLGYLDYTFNCFFNPLGKMLSEGFDNGVGYIRSPKYINSAVALAAIILQSSQNDAFGGQGFLHFDSDLAPYVTKEYERWLKIFDNNEEKAWEQTEVEVMQAMESFVYNMNTMRSRSGAQVTFSSVNFGTDTTKEGRLISKCLLEAFIKGLGNGENPIFPNLCFKLSSTINMKPKTPNYDLFKLALRCVTQRIQPRFVFCDSPAYENGHEEAGTMGCRTAVRSNINGDHNPDARGNLAFNNISLPYLALESGGDFDKFWLILDAAIDDAIRQLEERYNIIKDLRVCDVPFISRWYMGSDNLSDTDTIESYVKHGTLGVGFVGLAEALFYLVKAHHGQSKNAQELGLKIVGRIREKTDAATKEKKLNFGCFATPSESACHYLLKKARERFGKITGVTDKEFFTNSSHIPVDFDISIKDKIDIEAPYHLLCNGGHILYIEAGSSLRNNTTGLRKTVEYMAQSGAVYGGINWTHAYCTECGHQGDFNGVCPKCGSNKIKVTAIITGYLSTIDRFNDGKLAELKARVTHTE